MGRYKELFQNIGFLTISSFGSKILSFFLVPLYTSILTAKDYGDYDIVYTTMMLLVPFLTINITEGAMRFLLDKNADKENICELCFKITNRSIIVIILLCLINYTFNIIPFFKEYTFFFILLYVTYTYYLSAQNIARGLDKLKLVGASGLINSVLMILFNIFFLVVLKVGLAGYFYANILANGFSAIYLIGSTKLHRHLLGIVHNHNNLNKEITDYSKPLMLNSLGWWINNVSDRYIVTIICGSAVNGVYSVAYKIPSILSILQTIFNQAWLISVTKEYKEKNDSEFAKRIYHIYNTSTVLICSLLIIVNKALASLLYKGDFYEAWNYVPLLLLSIVFSAMSGAIGVIFGAEKDSKILGRTTLAGAIINTILNIILVYAFGAIGAAIATAVSCFLIWLIRIIACQKYIKIEVSKNDIISYILLAAQSISYIAIRSNYLWLFQILILFSLLIINKNIIYEVVKKVIHKIGAK